MSELFQEGLKGKQEGTLGFNDKIGQLKFHLSIEKRNSLYYYPLDLFTPTTPETTQLTTALFLERMYARTNSTQMSVLTQSQVRAQLKDNFPTINKLEDKESTNLVLY